jgi:hypothetical protein
MLACVGAADRTIFAPVRALNGVRLRPLGGVESPTDASIIQKSWTVVRQLPVACLLQIAHVSQHEVSQQLLQLQCRKSCVVSRANICHRKASCCCVVM